MKLMIDIPEEAYKLGTLGSYFGCYSMKLHDTILNGTVLPKHGRLIEVTDELDYQLSTYERWTGIDELPYEYAVMEIRNAPTILEAWGNEE